MNTNIYDIIVIGAGVTGLYITFIAGYLKLKTLCIELTESVGGQLSKLYPEKMVYDFPTQISIKAKDIIHQLVEQIDNYKEYSQIILNTSIVKYYYKDEIIVLCDENNNEYYAKNVILTIGIGSFVFNKLEKFPQSHDHHKVIYYLDNKNNFLNKEIIVLGGGNSAIDISYQLKTQYNAKVTLIHHSKELKGQSFSHDELTNNNIKIILDAHIHDWSEDECSFLIEDKIHKLKYDYLVVQYGLKPLESKIHQLNNILIKNRKIIVDHDFMTNANNIYAAGDCIFHPNHINSIISGISEATIIVNKIKNNYK